MSERVDESRAPRTARRARWMRALRKALLGAGAAGTVAALVWAQRHGGEAWAALRDHAYFRVARIEVAGAGGLVGEAELRARIGVREGESVWEAAPRDIEARLEAHPMIAAASVRRVFPDRIEVRVRERRPAAITLLDDLYYLDRDGESFGPLGPEHDRDYPVFTGVGTEDEPLSPDALAALDGLDRAAAQGPDDAHDGQRRWALRRALHLLRRWNRRASGLEVSELRLDPQVGLILHPVEPPVPLYLGWRGWERRLQRAESVLATWRDAAQDLARVDLRFRGQVVVELRGPQGPRGPLPGGVAGAAKVSA